MAEGPRILQTRRLREAFPPISEDEIELPSGRKKSWIRMHTGVSAAVLPLTVDGRVLLTREYRHGLGRVSHTLPGGTIKGNESPEECARRELLEETGHAARALRELYEGNSLTAYLEGRLHIFLADGCKPTGRTPDPDEIAGVESLTIVSALDRARRGEFESALVTLAILLADARGWFVA